MARNTPREVVVEIFGRGKHRPVVRATITMLRLSERCEGSKSSTTARQHVHRV